MAEYLVILRNGTQVTIKAEKCYLPDKNENKPRLETDVPELQIAREDVIAVIPATAICKSGQE